MLLNNKVAVIYGADGSIGSEVARTFADDGAEVFFAGQTYSALNDVAEQIHFTRGDADTAVVDATNERAVDDFIDSVVREPGRIDISFNLIGYNDVQQPPMDIAVEDFVQPVTTAVRTQFMTTRAAARHMVERETGVVFIIYDLYFTDDYT